MDPAPGMPPQEGPVAFVGREPLLATLRGALEESGSGRGTALLLGGEPGVGKTSTAQQLVRAAEALGFRVHTARCHETQGAPALWPWLRVVRSLLADGSLRLEPVQAGALTPLLPDGSEGGPAASADTDFASDPGARFRVFEALAELLRSAARTAPRLIWIDDLHWADAASLELARFALRELRDEPVVLLGGYRDGETLEGAEAAALSALLAESSVFPLGGLSEEEVARFMSQAAGFPVSPRLAAAVCARTGGNPLFVVEVVRLLEAEGRLGGAAPPQADVLGVPVSVAQMLRRRVEALSPGARELLRAAAVGGSESDGAVVARAAGRSGAELEAARSELVAQRLLAPNGSNEGRWTFAHDLLRDAVLEELEGDERARLHGALAEALVAEHAGRLGPHHAVLAHHYARAGTPERLLRAAEHAELGARRARAHFSDSAAQGLCALGLEALEGIPDPANDELRCRLLLGQGHALWQLGRRKDAQDRYREALERARSSGETEWFARAAVALAGRDDLAMEPPDDDSPLEQALEALPAGHAELRVRLLAGLVRMRRFAAPPERVEAWAREAVDLAERCGDPATSFAALEGLHYALLEPGTLEERLAIAERLPELARRANSSRFEGFAEVWRAVDALEAPDPSAVDLAVARLEQIAERTHQPFFAWLATGFRATRATCQGRIDEAERLALRAFELGSRAETPNALPFFGTQLFHVREEQGRVDELEPVMRQMLEERPEMTVFRIGIPLIHALTGRREAARSSFEAVARDDFADVPHDLHRLPLLTSAATVCAFLGDERRAEILHRELARHAGHVVVAGIGTHWAGPVDLYLGRLERALGRTEAAIESLGRAAELCRRGGAELIHAHCLAERASAWEQRAAETGASHAAAQAREDRERARRLYLGLGADWRARALSAGSATAAKPTRSRFARRGQGWLLEYAGTSATLGDSKGLSYLALLLAAPGRGLHVFELVGALASRTQEVALDGAEDLREVRGEDDLPGLDARALADYREHLRARLAERERARAQGDLGRVSALENEIGALESELGRALGLGGRVRAAASPVERARKSVYNRVRAAIRRIEAVHPALGRHLDATVRTGTVCEYRPEAPLEWELS